MRRKRPFRLIFLMLFGVALAAYYLHDNVPMNTDILPSEIGEMEVYFCPTDNCEAILVELFEAAESSIHCALFDLELENVSETLERRSEEIDVKLIVDNRNEKKVSDLEFARTDKRNALMHNKFCIFDSAAVFTGSFNPTERGAYKNNNNMLIIESEYLSENYALEFFEMWEGTFGRGPACKYPQIMFNGGLVENYFCPEDDCEEHVLDVLEAAEESIYFMTFSFTSDAIGDMLVKKHNEGVIVDGVFEKFQRSQYSEFNKLNDSGISCSYDTNPANMHHKVFIVDEETVILGSYNPTKSGTENNDENVLIIRNQELGLEYLSELKGLTSLES